MQQPADCRSCCSCRQCVWGPTKHEGKGRIYHHDAHAPAGGFLPLQCSPLLHVSCQTSQCLMNKKNKKKQKKQKKGIHVVRKNIGTSEVCKVPACSLPVSPGTENHSCCMRTHLCTRTFHAKRMHAACEQYQSSLCANTSMLPQILMRAGCYRHICCIATVESICTMLCQLTAYNHAFAQCIRV